MNRLRLALLTTVVATVVGPFATPSALADDTSRERIFLVFSGDDAEALEQESMKFQSPVLKANRFEFAGTKEMETIYATCSEDIGTNAEARRECQLRAANRVMVTQVLELSGRRVDKETWDVTLEVWSPESNGLLWGDTLEIEAGSLGKAAREAHPELATRYLCWRGLKQHCAGDPRSVSATPSFTFSTDNVFEAGSHNLKPDGEEQLEAIAEALTAAGEVRYEIALHADFGEAELMLKFSQKRADAIREFLIEQGVDGERLVAKGYGVTQPVTSNETAAGAAQNRRVEIKPLP